MQVCVCVCGDTVGVVDVVLESNQTQLFFTPLFFTPLHRPKTPLKMLFWVFLSCFLDFEAFECLIKNNQTSSIPSAYLHVKL